MGTLSTAACGFLDPDYPKNPQKTNLRALDRQVRRARELAAGAGLVAVNAMAATSQYADSVRTALRAGVDAVVSGAGLPLNLPALAREVPESTAALAPIVSGGKAAGLICRAWDSRYGRVPDFVVLEGPKAGGHLGYKREQIDDSHYSLETLVPEIVAEVSKFGAEHDCHIPVIAGGGIYTGEDIYRIMELGAEGVQMGTRFVTTDECDADPAFKQSYIDARREDIEIIESPVGMPGRALRSSFLDRVREGLKRPKACPFDCIKTCDVTHSPYCIMLALYNAFKGKLQNGYAFCGANAWRAEKIQTVRELMSSLSAEYDSFAQKIKGLAR